MLHRVRRPHRRLLIRAVRTPDAGPDPNVALVIELHATRGDALVRMPVYELLQREPELGRHATLQFLFQVEPTGPKENRVHDSESVLNEKNKGTRPPVLLTVFHERNEVRFRGRAATYTMLGLRL
mgnify:FL=1